MELAFANPSTVVQPLIPNLMHLLTPKFAVNFLFLNIGLRNDITTFLSFFSASSDRITYLTDAMEDPEEEVNNVGFCLSFTQKKC